MTRSLGRSRVRGKQDEMEIVEVIWQEPSSLTQVVSIGATGRIAQPAVRPADSRISRRNLRGNADSRMFTIGRGEKNNLVVDQDRVSRSHADIEFRQGKFILVDGSTNGTYLLLDNGARFFVQRRSSLCTIGESSAWDRLVAEQSLT
jgi:adenylate cyclase